MQRGALHEPGERADLDLRPLERPGRLAGPAQQGGTEPVSGRGRQRSDGDLGLRAPDASLACAPGLPELCQPAREYPDRGPDRAARPHRLLPRGEQRGLHPARRRGLRESGLEGLEDPGSDCPPGGRAGARRPGEGGRAVRVADEPARRHLPGLGHPGRDQPARPRCRDPRPVPRDRRPEQEAGRLPRPPGRDGQ